MQQVTSANLESPQPEVPAEAPAERHPQSTRPAPVPAGRR